MPRFFALVRRGLRSAACSPILALAVMVAGFAQPLAAARVSPIHTHALGPADPMAIKVTLAHNVNGTAAVNVGATSSTTFTAQNLGTQTLTVSFVATVCNGALQAGSCAPSPTSRTMNPGDAVTVTVTFRGGASAGNGTLTLAAKNGSTTLASSSVAVTVNPTPGPTVSTSPHRGDAIDVSQCVADCFESTFGYTTPAYVSLDVPRSVTLLYRSGRAKPYGRLQLGAIDGNASVTSFRLQLTDSASGANVVFTNNSTSLFFVKKPGDTTRIVAEFDAAAIPTSARRYMASVTSYAGATPLGTTKTPVRIIVLNDRASIYGAGVDLVGLQRMFFTQSGGVLITDGSGSASFFAGICGPSVPCTFTSPGGDFSTLTTGNNQYRRTYPDGSAVTFDAGGNQLDMGDRFGAVTRIAYGRNANNAVVPWTITDPTGQTITFYYRSASEVNYTAGTLGAIGAQGTARLASFGVLPDGNLAHIYDFDGVWRDSAGYDGQHRLTQLRNKQGGVTSFGYLYGKTVNTIDAPGVSINGVPGVRPRTQVRDSYSGLYAAADSGHGSTYSAAIPVPTFDVRAAVNDPLGNGTYYTLSRFGSPTAVYAPLTNPAYATYDTLTGQLTRSVSPTGAVQRLTWVNDQLRQTIDSSAGAATTVNVEYETSYSLPTHIYGNVAEQLFTYDHTKAGWPLKTSKVGLSSALPTTYAVDAYGRPTSVVDPSGHTSTYAYETTGLRNHISVTAPNGQSTTFAHDAWGRDTLVKDPKLAAWRQGYDILNRVVWTLSPLLGDTTKFRYDSLDNVTKVTDSKGQSYTTLRNALGWVVKQIDPAGRVDSAAYDSAGRVVYTKSRQQRVVTFQYDALGRVTQQTGAGGSDNVTFAYDPGHRWVAARAVSRGALVSTDTIFTDSVGRTTSEWTQRPGSGSSWNVASFYNATDPGRAYVQAGRIGGPGPQAGASFLYDASKRLSIMQPVASGQTTFGYNADQKDSTVTFPSTLVETTTYTSSHALAKRGYNVTSVQTALGRAYRSDSLARLVQRGNSDGSKYQNFYYDAKSRFYLWEKKSQTSSPQCVNVGGYGYDCTTPGAHTDLLLGTSYDNVENPTDLGAVTSAGNRLTTYNGFGMTYDADGYLVKKVGAGNTDSLDWDAFGQLQKVIRGGAVIASFSYDGFGRRVKKTTPTATVQYVWDGGQIILEADGNGTTTQAYTYYPGTDRLHSVTAGGQTYYASIEPGGDVNGLIKATDNSVAAQYAYTPWGELETNVDSIGGVRVNSLRWKGLAYDVETGLYQIRARYYDPKLRRFISEDPIGLEGGINEYVFGSGDPVNHSDPSGLDDCKWVYDAGAWTSTYTVERGNEPLWIQRGRLIYECTEHMYEDPAARVGGSHAANGQTTNGNDGSAFNEIVRAARENAPSLDCLVKAGVFGAGLGLDVVTTVGGFRGLMAAGYVIEAGSLSLRAFTGNFIARLGRTFGTMEQNALLTASGANMIHANPEYFGNDGIVSNTVASANSPSAGDFSWTGLIPFSGTRDRWEAASLACGQ